MPKENVYEVSILQRMLNRNEFYLFAAIILLLIIGGFAADGYLSLYNLSRLLRQLSIMGLVALGMSVVIIGGNGGIDLSVGSIFGIATMVAISLQNKVIDTTGPGSYVGLDLPLILLMFCVLLSGAVFGLVNGIGVVKLRVPPFIMTLATMAIGRGLIMTYSQGFQFRGARPDFEFLGGGMFFEIIPLPLLFFIILSILFHLVAHRSKFGRELFASGSNIQAARLSGVKTGHILTYTYIISGILSAFAGLLFAAFTTTADPWAGEGLELEAISAALVGGIPLVGGIGTILGAVLGVLFIGLLGNLLVLLDFDPYDLQLATAIIILVVVWMQSRSERKIFSL